MADDAGRESDDGAETPPAPARVETPASHSPDVDQTVQLANLLAAVEDSGEVLVLTHDNPDPDAIASAAALSFLLERAGGLSTTLGFGGIIGRAENRALIQELGVPFERLRAPEIPASASVALVDTQPRAGNNSLPDGRIATVVVDHHPLRPESTAVTFADVRPGYGASCTILVEYLQAAQLEPPPGLATALFYGIQSETMDLGREVSPPDVEASVYLYPRSDPAATSRIRHARVPAGYFESMHEALEEARRFGGVIMVPMGRLDYPDMVAEVADLFMRVEGVEWTVASGRYHDDLLISMRTYDPGGNAGERVQRAIGDRGSAGGHGMLAGAQVSLKGRSDPEVEELVTAILGDLCRELGVDRMEGESLIPLGSSEAPGEDGGDA